MVSNENLDASMQEEMALDLEAANPSKKAPEFQKDSPLDIQSFKNCV